MNKVVELKNVSLRVLEHVDLEVHRGEVFGIIGMSGAGKTTVMRLLTALDRPSEGQVFVAGESMSTLEGKPLRQARKKIGMIFQHFNLLSSRTALGNVLYPCNDEKRACELLDLVGLKGKEHLYPAQLSGGEKQRVAIARALIHQPDVLLCDEATSALDPRTTESILELLSSLNQKLGLTIVLITHEMEVIKQICTHVAVLEHGQIVEHGEVAQLFAHPKHPTTKRFLQNVQHEIIRSEEAVLLRLSFTGETAGQPIISRLIREHDVEVNILLGGIDVLKTETVGNLVVELSGPDRALARAFLEKQGVGCDEF